MVAKPPKPGRDPAGKFPTLQDVRATGATTQEIQAVMPGEIEGDRPAAVEPVDNTPLKPPMKSALVPTLIAFGILLFVVAMIALSR